MDDPTLKRLSRLTAILTVLQTKKIVTSAALAQKFGVSMRTIYRDMKALEEAGVPIVAEERKGYSLLDGYRIPPVMFTESEANTLITVERLVQTNADHSLVREYTAAMDKIKSVLSYATKDKAGFLSERIAVSPAIQTVSTSSLLASAQHALTHFTVLKITYHSEGQTDGALRVIEPFAFYYSLSGNWLLIAYCRLRKDYRMFRLDRISGLELSGETFEPHKMTLKEFLETKQKNFKVPDIPLS
jgi:predicted DNA-binding transcriptional regulator YafY